MLQFAIRVNSFAIRVKKYHDNSIMFASYIMSDLKATKYLSYVHDLAINFIALASKRNAYLHNVTEHNSIVTAR